MRRDGGSSLPSVIVSMVIFGICFTAMLQGYARGTAAMWNARVNQEATAVAAWHSALVQQGGCVAVVPDPTNDPKPKVPALAGRNVLPNDGFRVTCDDTTGIPWPPPLTGSASPCVPAVDADCAAKLTVTVEWNTRSHAPRSYEQTVLQSPTGP